MTAPPIRLYTAYQDHFDHPPQSIISVPEREIWIAAEVEGGHQITLIVPDVDNRTTFDRRSAKSKRTVRNRPLPIWARYAAGVVLILSDDQLTIPGFTGVVVGNEPTGPRYHYSLGMAVAALLYDHNQQTYDTPDLLALMERVQKHYKG
mgnify:CR=1 FL=1